MAVTEVQTYHIECQETTQWIRDKARLIKDTEELGNDLGGIMVLQRRLKGMESDLAAIEAKVNLHQLYCKQILRKFSALSHIFFRHIYNLSVHSTIQ